MNTVMNMVTNMPNFLVIGAAKAGTTSLANYLDQHPDIYMSPMKEPKFFALEGEDLDFRGPGDQEGMKRYSVTNLEDYQALFQKVTTERAIGEASTLYLYSPKAVERIRYFTPAAKLIAIIRNPVERAYSNFLHNLLDGLEPLTDFAEALRVEEDRIRDNWAPKWHYRTRGYYYGQLRRYFEAFDPGQVKVYLYDDFNDGNADELPQSIFGFLGVDESYSPDVTKKHNVSGMPKSKLLHNFVVRPNLIKAAVKPFLSNSLRRRISGNLKDRNLVKTPMSPAVREWLTDAYRADVLKLQDLLNRDLSKWLELERGHSNE